jgi:class 3 adenylate cyclase
VALLLVVWVLYLGAVVRAGLAPGGEVIDAGIASAPGPDSHPVVVGPGLSGSPEPALPVGTRILEVGGRDAAGLTAVGTLAAIANAARGLDAAPVRIEIDGEIRDARLPIVSAQPPWWISLPFANGLILSSLLLLFLAPHWHLGMRHFTSCVIIAFSVTRMAAVGPVEVYASTTAVLVCIPLALAVVIRDGFEFFERPRSLAVWQRVLPWAFAVAMFAAMCTGYLTPYGGPHVNTIVSVIVSAFAVAAIGAFVWSYRLADAVGRRQFKWVLLGFSVAIVAAAVTVSAPYLVAPELVGLLRGAMYLSQACAPLGIFIAIAAYDLLDIDRVISTSAAYALLAVGLFIGAFAIVPPVAAAASPVVGLEPGTGQLLLSMALAALVVPSYNALRPRLDRMLMAEQQRVVEGMDALLEEISKCDGVESITQTAGERLLEIFEPDSLVLYAAEGELFTPVFVHGRAVPPAFEADGPLIGVLDKQQGALAAGRWSGEQEAKLNPFDRAALETLGAALVGPTRRGPTLVGFWCMGPKRSGDIYTPTDLALMRALGAKISEELLRLDDERVIAEAQQMHASMRRYVPEAVAQRIESGQEVEDGEREVSVLFVDIRGYVRFSEPRDAEEVFSSLNRHTELVSALVDRHGGSVVEFHGDGVMAVFGAPHALDNKAGAAIEAARDIVSAMRSRDLLSVGIGVATGSAFVGNIQSNDRSIWSVIGNTTNLAARLQTLTREFDASICIDEPTHSEARGSVIGFAMSADVAIRGRSNRLNVWTLPL